MHIFIRSICLGHHTNSVHIWSCLALLIWHSGVMMTIGCNVSVGGCMLLHSKSPVPMQIRRATPVRSYGITVSSEPKFYSGF